MSSRPLVLLFSCSLVLLFSYPAFYFSVPTKHAFFLALNLFKYRVNLPD